MCKVMGSVLIMCSTIFIFSQKVLENYFTYKFLHSILGIIVRIQYENGANIPYIKVFEKIGFNYTEFFIKVKTNGYIKRCEIEYVQYFFENLGKRDKNSEKEYIEYHLSSITQKVKDYQKTYSEIKKSHIMCGIAAGLTIIIFFI